MKNCLEHCFSHKAYQTMVFFQNQKRLSTLLILLLLYLLWSVFKLKDLYFSMSLLIVFHRVPAFVNFQRLLRWKEMASFCFVLRKFKKFFLSLNVLKVRKADLDLNFFLNEKLWLKSDCFKMFSDHLFIHVILK